MYRNGVAMTRLMRFPGSIKRDPAIDAWMHQHSGQLVEIAQRWFEFMRACGYDVREVLHDGHPTACVGDAAFGYVNVFKITLMSGSFVALRLLIPMVFWRALTSSCAM